MGTIVDTMPNSSADTTVQVFNSPGEELRPDVTSYLIRGENRVVLVDPGPQWHLERHLELLRTQIDPEAWLFALVLAPCAGCLSGLDTLARLSRHRAVILDWTLATVCETGLDRWQIRSPNDTGGTVPLGTGGRVSIVRPGRPTVPGALLAYHDRSQTLFTGAFFGSVGRGKTSDKPVLRRESVRAYTDAFTLGLDARIVLKPIDDGREVSQIGPAYGRLAVGGRRLIDAVFALDRGRPDPALAFYRLYLRIAGLLGEETAAGIFQAAQTARPDLEQGYTNATSAGPPETRWSELHEKIEAWLTPPSLTLIRTLMARLSVEAGLPVPDGLRRLAGTTEAKGEYDTPVHPVNDEGAVEVGGSDSEPVTGLPGEDSLRSELRDRADSDAEARYALLLISVDNIERINRRYGRSGGDDALYTVSYLLRNHHAVRQAGGGQAYKLSGPVFACLLPGASREEAAGIAEQIRKATAESSMFLEQLTVSIGLAVADELAGETANNDAGVDNRLLDMAGARLAVARSGGMNTVCASDPEGAASLSSGATVLIADPDAPYLETLTRLLDERGFSVLVAEDGEDALEIISQIVPDAIVCEAMLPKFNGFSVREQLRRSSELARIPFILISHRKNDELLEKAALLGIVHFLRKPISLTELSGLLDNLTGAPE